eukprot:7503216-Pyramimonas_sp.AAC.1
MCAASSKCTAASHILVVDVPGSTFWRDSGLPGRNNYVGSRCWDQKTGFCRDSGWSGRNRKVVWCRCTIEDYHT